MENSTFTKIIADNKIKAAERKRKALQNTQAKEQQEIDNMSTWERVGVTLADFFTEIGGGLAKGLEGVVDVGALIAGGVGSLFGADTKWSEDFISRDLTQEWWYDWEDEFTKGSYINEAPIVKDVIRGVGQQIPAIALNFIPGVGTALSMTYLGLSAGGTGTEEALNEGANLGEAAGYGAIQSLIEFGTEKVTAGLGKGLYSVGKSSAKSVGKVAAEEFVSESIEEGLSALVNPLAKAVTYEGEKVLDAYKDLTFYLDAGQQALVGGVVGAIIGGSSAGIQRYSAGGKQNFMIEQSLAEIQRTDLKESNLWKNNKLNSANRTQMEEQIKTEINNISNQLKSLTETERINTIKKYNLADEFDNNGNIIAEINENTQDINQDLNTPRKPLISDNIEAYSPSLRNTKLTFAPTQNTLSQSSLNAKRFITSFNPQAKIVFTDNIPSNINAFYDTNSKILYFSNEATTQEVVAHEFTHSLEGTKEYESLKKYILDNTDNLETRIAEKIEQYKNVNTEVKSGDNGQFVARYEAETEIVAEEMGKYLSDADTVQRIVNQSKSRAYRIWQWIKDVITKITKRGESGEYYKFIRNVENLYTKAIQNSIGGIGLTDVRYAIDEFEKLAKQESESNNSDTVLDNSNENRYNLSKDNLWNKLTKQDQALLYKSIDELHHQNYYKYRLDNGDYVIEVNNKIILTDGSFQRPSIEGIVDFNQNFPNQISEARDYFYEKITNGRTIQESIEFINSLYEEEVAIFYGKENSKYNKTISKQGRYNSENRKNRAKGQREGSSGDARYSLKDTVEQDVLNTYGKTYSWKETGYILQDGTKLDLSGKNNGAPGGYRSVDHREIFDIYDDSETYGTDAMIEFMARGNIRVIPEYPGINMQIEPTEAQYQQIKSLIENLGWKEKSFIVDFDNSNGETIDSLSYENAISANKIIDDIKYYFKEGKVPYKSQLSDFRYSLKDSENNYLSKEQIEFFKDSKVRDEKGNLLVVYHGSKNSNFFEFIYNSDNQTGTDFGKAFYFTTNYENAKGYSHNASKDPRIMEFQDKRQELIEKFLHEKSIENKEKIKKQIKLLKVDGKTLQELINDINYDTGGEVKVCYLNLTNPLVKNANGEYYYDVYYEYFNEARKNGNDGLIVYNVNDSSKTNVGLSDVYIAFEPNQIKLTTNKAPTLGNDIRFSLKDGNGDYNFSKGQIAKYVAEHSKSKAYSKTDAEQVINTIVANQLSFGEKYGEISNKTKDQVIDTLWHALNTKPEGYRGGIALEIADYIIDNAIAEDIYQNDSSDADTFVIDVLKDYLHKIDLSGIKSEIKYRYDNDNSPYLIWGKRKGTQGQSPDQIAMELSENGLHLDATNEADIFFEIDEMYRKAIKNLKKSTKQRLSEVLDETSRNELKQTIARDVLNSFDTTGHKTRFAETIEKYTSKISSLKSTIKDIKLNNRAKNNVISTIERLRDEFIKNKPAGWKIPQQVVDFVRKIAKVETWRNNISSTARQHLSELQLQLDSIMDETQQNIYPYRETLIELGSGEGELTTEELITLDNILRQFAWQLRNYDNVVFEGKSVSNTELANQGVQESKQAQKILKSGDKLLVKFKNKVYANPFDRMAEFGLYRNNSIMVRLYNDMLAGDRRRANFVRDSNNLFDDFLKKNKNYLKELQKEIIVHADEKEIKMSKRQALSLYLTSLREQGRTHLFNITDDSGVIRLLDNQESTKGNTLQAFAKGKDVEITRDTIKEIKEQLTALDKEYLDLVDIFFNKMSKEAKTDTDKQLYGITNVENDYYFPIKVSKDKIYTEAGQNDQNINQYILNMGMNKTIKPNASNKIVIDGIDNIIAKHINDMSLYYGFAIPLTAYNRIMNKQVLVNDTDTTSNIRSEIQKIDTTFENYMNRLWQDIQGIQRGERGFISNVLSKIRWAGANAALGANPKVLVTQTLSLASSLSEFNPKYIVKGLGHFFGEKNKLDLAKYSSLMYERMQLGNSVDIAEIRQIGKEIGNKFGQTVAKITKGLNTFTTKPISWMDSNVIQSLWFAAQYEIADTRGKGYEFGTEANKIEAGKRLDEVVFHTQQTSDPIGRSEWLRSDNEIVKFARMFTSDAIQLTGKMIASVNKYKLANKMIKSGDTELVKQGQEMLSSSKTAVIKSSSAFILNQVMLLAIALAFKWIKGKNDDEEWSDIAKNEAIANLVGLIPFGGDIFDKLSGYEPTNMAYTALSNTVEIAEDLYNGISTLITGDYQDPVKRNAAMRKTALSISRLLGIPTQNLESYLKGIIGKISPSTREEYEALFKTKSISSYLEKMKKATENGDEKLAETIVNILFNSRTGKIKDDNMLDMVSDLLGQGYDVLPKTVNSSIIYDGVEYTLTNRQHKQFMDIYSKSNDIVKNMISLSTFNKLDDGAKAKAINFVYDYYYNLAIEDMIGEDIETKTMLFAEAIPIAQLAMAVAQASIYTADTDIYGNVINGSKKAKVQNFIQSLKLSAVQKYMIMGYLGYSNKYGESNVRSYINRLNISKEAKEYLLEASGYAA